VKEDRYFRPQIEDLAGKSDPRHRSVLPLTRRPAHACRAHAQNLPQTKTGSRNSGLTPKTDRPKQGLTARRNEFTENQNASRRTTTRVQGLTRKQRSGPCQKTDQLRPHGQADAKKFRLKRGKHGRTGQQKCRLRIGQETRRDMVTNDS